MAKYTTPRLWGAWALAGAVLLTASAAASVEQQLRDISQHSVQQRVLLEFDRAPSAAEIERLRSEGIELLSPASSTSFYAKLDRGVMRPNRIAQMNSVRVAREIPLSRKLHPALRDGIAPDYARDTLADTPNGVYAAAYVTFHQDIDLLTDGFAIAAAYGADITDYLVTVNGLVIEIPEKQLPVLASDDRVKWVEPALPPMQTFNATNRVVTQAETAQASPYNLDGSGVNVFVYDGGVVRASHVDFGGRAVVIDNDSVSTHPTHVAGTVGGDGSASGGTHRGMAPAVNIISAGFQFSGGGTFLYSNPGDIEADYTEAMFDFNADLSNNSIGSNVEPNGFSCSLQGDYGVTSSVLDAIVRGSLGRPMIVIWANGNERQGSRCNVEGFNDYYSMPPPSGAKNIISIGAINANNETMTSFSSWGPMDDGRLKPDLVAPGCQSNGDGGITSLSGQSDTGYSSLCGTSMASPTVAGLAALMLEDYRVQFPGADNPLQSTVKVLLANSAVDLGNFGPDYLYGYGSVRVVDAIDLMRTGQFDENLVEQGGTEPYNVEVAPGSNSLKITLAWDDAPAAALANPAIVNDLDLVVTSPSGQRFFPWTLDPANPSAAAVRNTVDRINVSEQVQVENPEAGTWTVEVLGFNVPQGPQTFSIASSSPIAQGSALSLTIPQPLPTLVPAGELVNLRVKIAAINDSLVADSAQLRYRFSPTAPFESLPLSPIGNDEYEVSLPAPTCASLPEFFFVAEGTSSGIRTNPAAGELAPFDLTVGELQISLDDDFETDLGWQVIANATTGNWERAAPQQTSVTSFPVVQPGSDFSNDGTLCFVTGAAAGSGGGSFDLDGGPTDLISPTVDLTGGGTISYARYFHISTELDDALVVLLSNDNGDSWVEAERVTGISDWTLVTLNVEDFLPATSEMKIRFSVSDNPNTSLTEALVDEVTFESLVCSDPFVLGDVNCDGTVNTADIDAFVQALLDPEGYNTNFPDCDISRADMNSSGDVNTGDIDLFVDALLG